MNQLLYFCKAYFFRISTRINLINRFESKIISSPTIRVISGLAGGNIAVTVLGVLGSIIQARFVSPEDLGYFRGFSIVTGYAFFLHLGLWDALQRLYPYYIGKGQRDRAIGVAEICQFWNIMISILISGVFFALALGSLVNGNWRAMVGWLTQVVAVLVSIYGGFLGATYRSGQDFNTVTKSSLIFSFASLFTLPFFWFWPYIGLALRNSFGGFVSLLYLHAKRPLHLKWRFNWKEWLNLIKIGYPLFIAYYGANTGFITLQATIVLNFLGTQALGFLSVSVMLLEGINKIPQALVAVYIPRIIEKYGQTDSITDCLKMIKVPVLWGLLGTLFMVVVGSAVLPFVVPLLMPKYIGAIPVLSLMFLMLPMIVLEMPNTILVAMGKTVQLNTTVYVGLGIYLLLTLILISSGFGLSGVIIASLISRLTRISIIYILIYSLIKQESIPVQ